jgi:hypothetical protein
MFPVRYKLSFYIPEDDILHSHQFSARRQGEKVAGPGQSFSLGPAWELLDTARIPVASPVHRRQREEGRVYRASITASAET